MATAVAVDAAGGAVATGWSFGPESLDYLTIRYAPNGDTVWSRRYDGPSYVGDRAHAVALDATGNVHITGQCSEHNWWYSIRTIKYGSTGTELWNTLFYKNNWYNDVGHAIALDGSGNVYVCGVSHYESNGRRDYLTVKYNSSGQEQWYRRYRPSGDWHTATSIAVDGSGNPIVTGCSYGIEFDYATIKYSPTGETLWANRYNGPGNGADSAFDVDVDATGNVFITGVSYGGTSGFDWATVKYSPAGTQLWVSRHNGSGNGRDAAYSLVVDYEGNVVVVGSSYGTTSQDDIKVIKYRSTDGAVIWEEAYDGPAGNVDVATAVSIDLQNNVLVTGRSPGVGTSFDYVTLKYRPYPKDVSVARIVSPASTVDSGVPVAPIVVVKNRSNLQQTFPVVFTVGGAYADTQSVFNLAPDDSAVVTFDDWVPLMRGTSVARCSTALGGDLNPRNDTLSRPVFVRVVDAGAVQINAPAGEVDSGTVVIPEARVRNYGNQTVAIPVTFKIGSSYNQTRTKTLLAGAQDTVKFPSWTALQRGTHAVVCSTALAGDLNPANDALSGSVRVRVLDAACFSLLAPKGVVDSGAVVTPACSLYNAGTDTVSYSVRMKVGMAYNNTVSVSVHAPGSYRHMTFPNWTALQRGTSAVRCSTELAGDLVQVNNLRSDSVVVKVTDAAVSRILEPVGAVDSGAVVNPRAVVRNLGSMPVSFPVTLRIGSFYSNTQNVTSLAPRDSATVQFSTWLAAQMGTHLVKCTTALAGDQIPTNDLLIDSVTVQVLDVGITRILTPSTTVDSGVVVTPMAWVRSYGNTPVSFPVRMRIGSFYDTTTTVNNLNPGDSTVVAFANWIPTERGTFDAKCSTQLAGDRRSTNDAVGLSVFVRVRDVSVQYIFRPRGYVDSGAVVVPEVSLCNYGNAEATFQSVFRIHRITSPPAGNGSTGSLAAVSQTDYLPLVAPGASPGVGFSGCEDQVYEDSITVTLPPDRWLDTVFGRPWTAASCDSFRTEAFTRLQGDLDPGNDTARGWVVANLPIHDVGATAILRPSGTIDSGAVVTPTALVRNFGNREVEEIMVLFRIGSTYVDTADIELGPGEEEELDFRQWAAHEIGALVVKCSTMYPLDVNPSNDYALDSVIVLPAGGLVEQRKTTLPVRFTLEESTPSPFNRTTIIGYALPVEARVDLCIYDASGVLVRTLSSGTAQAGYYSVFWDGRDGGDKKLGAGVYYCRLVAGSFAASRKLVKSE